MKLSVEQLEFQVEDVNLSRGSGTFRYVTHKRARCKCDRFGVWGSHLRSDPSGVCVLFVCVCVHARVCACMCVCVTNLLGWQHLGDACIFARLVKMSGLRAWGGWGSAKKIAKKSMQGAGSVQL
jgi:hypothetical protein